MKKRKQMLALLLGMTMAASTVCMGSANEGGSDGTAVTEAPEWMNTDSIFPLVKDGYEKTLTIYARNGADYGDPEESWVYKYLTEECNINLEITTFTADNADEFLSLAFAGNDLPDIIIGANFTADELVKYGVQEGQIVDIAPYLNETIMPNLSTVYGDYPSYKSAVTDSEGHMWSVGYIQNPEAQGESLRFFYNYDWLEELGLEVPGTVDEFIAAMKAIKEAGYSEYPIGGSASLDNPGIVILNALGYLSYSSDADGSEITLRDGKVVLPYYDSEVFPEYLKIMNQLYTEGLLHPDFFSMDTTTTSAEMSKKPGFLVQAPFVYIADEYTSYWGGSPLTSEWNETAQSPISANSLSAGNTVITSACEEPELACRFLDIWYNTEVAITDRTFNGPFSDETDILYDMVSGKDRETNEWIDYANNPEQYSSIIDYLNKEIKAWENAHGLALPYLYQEHEFVFDFSSYEDWSDARHELLNQDPGFRYQLLDTISPYYTDEVYPVNVYLTPETSSAMQNLKVAMDEYSSQEIAKFIIGERELTEEELNDYFDTLTSLGADEYLQTYTDYYASLQ